MHWHTHLTNCGYFDYETKPEDQKFELYAGIQMVQFLRSLVYTSGLYALWCTPLDYMHMHALQSEPEDKHTRHYACMCAKIMNEFCLDWFLCVIIKKEHVHLVLVFHGWWGQYTGQRRRFGISFYVCDKMLLCKYKAITCHNHILNEWFFVATFCFFVLSWFWFMHVFLLYTLQRSAELGALHLLESWW